MTRGRKKDLTIPPTRALIQQRDYRARRAHYITSLEERCRRVEEENAQLREELTALKAGNGIVPSIPRNHETAAATIQLMEQLSLATASLARFQQIAFPEHPPSVVMPTGSTKDVTDHTSRLSLPPVTLMSPSTSPMSVPPTCSQSEVANEYHSTSTFSESGDAVDGLSRSVSPECCGGILDCRHLIEPEPSNSLTRTSGLRSTSASNFGRNKGPYR